MASCIDPRPRGLSRPLAAGVVASVLGISALIGRRNAPGPAHPQIRRWYDGLRKPGFTPPAPVFGAVWPVLEAGLGVGGYRLLRQPPGPARNVAVGLWLANTAMVGGWTEVFFRKRALAAGSVVAAAMTVTGTALVIAAARTDRPTAALAVPFAAWLAFATVLAERVREENG